MVGLNLSKQSASLKLTSMLGEQIFREATITDLTEVRRSYYLIDARIIMPWA